MRFQYSAAVHTFIDYVLRNKYMTGS